ncbi:MAG: VOC family protein [Gemmatimonadales bacterium]
MTNRVVAWQVVSPDPGRSARFLEELFGWATDQDNALGYRRVTGAGIDGGVWPAPQGVQPFVQLFVEVADLDAGIARAEALGAKVIVPKSVLPDGDAMAVLLDPLGMTIGLCTPPISRRSGVAAPD